MSHDTDQSTPSSAGQNSPLPARLKPMALYGIPGLLIGMVATALIAWQAMPGMMLTVHQSKYGSVEQTCDALKIAIESAGWNCPAVRDMNQSMAKHGVTHDRPIRIVELCNATYASEVLGSNPEVSTLMPCAWGVYKGADDKVYIAGMNMGLMGKMFGGKIAQVMGGHVAVDEHKMLSSVIVP